MSDNKVFYNLSMELTYKCNEKCIHCYLPDERSTELNTKQIIGILEEFYNIRGFSLLLTGGEIFYRKDILEILHFLKDKQFLISILSNLTLLTDKMLEAVAALFPRAIGCSIYSARENLHDSITQVNGSFAKSIASIKQLRSAGIPVCIKSPLMKSTAPYWREIEDLANQLNCDYQFDLNISAKNDGGKDPLLPARF